VSEDSENFDELDAHLDAEAVKYGTAYMASLYTNLRNAGLGRADAAMILACMIQVSEGPGEQHGQN